MFCLPQQGLKELGESVASNLMGQRGTTATQQSPPTNMPTPGVVTIRDTQVELVLHLIFICFSN